ncbi:hypothetical protein ASZ90_004602 [hydrocarbon metagenome]|uniref:Uncharacterized protein n=1 Tax=hydrocarbon metagenome TaxID=938273 RepID=A0A0W8FXH0_9ZZZZ
MESKNNNPKTRMVNVFMNEEQRQTLRNEAAKRGISMSALLKIALMEKINKEKFA